MWYKFDINTLKNSIDLIYDLTNVNENKLKEIIVNSFDQKYLEKKKTKNILINIILNKNKSSLKYLKLMIINTIEKKDFKNTLLINLSILYFITIN